MSDLEKRKFEGSDEGEAAKRPPIASENLLSNTDWSAMGAAAAVAASGIID